MIYSTIMEVGRTISDAFAKAEPDDARVSSEQVDLTAVILFVAGGLLLTAAFFTAGLGAEIGQILAASG